MSNSGDRFLGGFLAGTIFGSVAGGLVGAYLAHRLLKSDQLGHGRWGDRPGPDLPEGNGNIGALDDSLEGARLELEHKIAQLSAAIEEVRDQIGQNVS